MASFAKETYRTDAPQCPHCGYVHQHDGGFFYDEGLTEFDCERCDQRIEVSVYTSTSWTCQLPEPTEGDQP